MLHDDDSRIREVRAQLKQQRLRAFSERAHDSDTVHLIRCEAAALKAPCQTLLRQLTANRAACQLLFLDRGDQYSVAQQCARGIAQDPAKSDDDHLLLSALLDFCPGITQGDCSV